MTRIYEALEQAEKERGGIRGKPIIPQPRRSPLKVSHMGGRTRPGRRVLAAGPDVHLEQTMAALYQSLVAMLPDAGGRSIQFIGTGKGEGASTLVREFAKTAAFKLGKSVLLLDADQDEPCQLGLFNVVPQHGWEECIRNGTPLQDSIHRVGEERLFASQVSVQPSRASRVFDLPKIGEFFEVLKEHFDLVLVDAPAASVSSDGFALSRRVDGVVMVVEAEKTRRQAARKTKGKIEDHGGTVLGVILNRRRYPIPAWLYRWM